MSDSEAKIVKTPEPAPPKIFTIGASPNIWGAVHAHLLMALRRQGSTPQNREMALLMVKAIGAQLVQHGALSLADLELVYMRESLSGGNYYGPASAHVKAMTAAGAAPEGNA